MAFDINSICFPMKRTFQEDMAEKTPVSVLQELCIQEKSSVPIYEPIDHDDPRMFAFVVCAFDLYAEGSGRSKREARHDACANLISKLTQNP